MSWPSILPAFFASCVEFVEALPIVLAVGVTINWRSSLWGAAAFAALAVFVATFGAAAECRCSSRASRSALAGRYCMRRGSRKR